MDVKSTFSKYFNKQTAVLAIGTIGASVAAVGAFSQGNYLVSIASAVTAAFGGRLWKVIADGRLNADGTLKPPAP